ncbi:hypothetical protein PC9H_001421 [Pleurotus ostreatus]|uniref:glucan 1,3-beta-glucosidase n=2 Tax=Pleurotus ostreatus TaxID=5322 RepID=A0A067PDE5_PLEO1|nr:uncharacterized protein PC9H_001421 [Pleurotus ostreatus]KAF7441072.1 hypothetical protein PC9H_001421 [Pleurotus ostreatus]KDQ33886.1 glycoside hydrolase family 5 protein [Pleurotus ostreatus PC15]
MSNPQQPSANISYDPLPLTTDADQYQNALYNAPGSPGPASPSFQNMRELGSTSSLPPGASAAQPRFMGTYDGHAGPRESYASSQYPSGGSDFNGSVVALNDTSMGGRTLTGSPYRDEPDSFNEQGHAMSPMGQSSSPRYLGEKQNLYAAPRAKSSRKVLILAVLASLILLILAVVIPVYFAVIKPRMRNSDNDSSNDSDSSNSDNNNSHSPQATGKPQVKIVTGRDGSEITTEDGSKFTYENKLGGYWYWDEDDVFNNGAKAQSWTPALNETFRYGIDKIRGVNLGGWLVTEPPYADTATPAVDEWTLTENLRRDNKMDVLENHYKTFITEKDFADIAGAGLNYLRVPIPFWAVETKPGEPFLQGTAWTYFLKAIQWARKYGLRINLDLHAVPGSQNGWNHSGRLGQTNFLNGPMGIANAERTLDVIRVMTQFISQPQYKDVVTMFGILNEPQGTQVGQEQLSRFYMEAYNVIREVTGVGEGKGPYISYHDGFFPRSTWPGVFGQADRIALDSHPYLCFGGQSDNPMSSYANVPCQQWGASMNSSLAQFGVTTAGEFSNAVTDCGLYLNGVNLGTRYEGNYPGAPNRVGSCTEWTDWTKYTPKMRADIKQFALASMDALQNYFFWTWKIGNSSVSGKVETPAWSYSLGLQEGWMPKNTREADGTCGNTDPFQPPLAAWQTGGAGAGNIPAATASGLSWPPPTISNAGAASLLPSYTRTGPIPTLHGPTFTGSSMTATPSVGNGWANPSDSAGYYTEVAGCSYLDPWVGPTAAPPSPLCPGAPAARRAAPTPAP